MKRLITFTPIVDTEGVSKGIIRTISDPIDTEAINFVIDESVKENSAYVDADIPKPPSIFGKRAVLIYNRETCVIEVTYEDIEPSQLTLPEQLQYLRAQNEVLKNENAELREELELTQAALFELDAQVNGGVDNE